MSTVSSCINYKACLIIHEISTKRVLTFVVTLRNKTGDPFQIDPNFVGSLYFMLGLNEIYVWFLLPTYPNFFNPTLNIKMVSGEKIPKMGIFSDFVTIFFVKYYNII